MRPTGTKPTPTKLEIEHQIEELEELLETFPKGCVYDDAKSWKILGDDWAFWVIISLVVLTFLNFGELWRLGTIADKVQTASDQIGSIPRPYPNIVSCGGPVSSTETDTTVTFSCQTAGKPQLGFEP